MRLKKNECAIVIDENGGIVSLSIPKNIAKHDCVSDGMMAAMAILSLSKRKNKVFAELIRKEVKAICRKAKIIQRKG